MLPIPPSCRSVATPCQPIQRSIVSNREVFDFLESAAKKYGMPIPQPQSDSDIL